MTIYSISIYMLVISTCSNWGIRIESASMSCWYKGIPLKGQSPTSWQVGFSFTNLSIHIVDIFVDILVDISWIMIHHLLSIKYIHWKRSFDPTPPFMAKSCKKKHVPNMVKCFFPLCFMFFSQFSFGFLPLFIVFSPFVRWFFHFALFFLHDSLVFLHVSPIFQGSTTWSPSPFAKRGLPLWSHPLALRPDRVGSQDPWGRGSRNSAPSRSLAQQQGACWVLVFRNRVGENPGWNMVFF